MQRSVLNEVSIVGASDNPGKPGGKIVENLLRKGYSGQLLLINANSPRVQGRPTLASIADLPCAPDLAYIAIPARFVADALTELAGLGTRRVVVLSAGFGEIDEKGRRACVVTDAGGLGVMAVDELNFLIGGPVEIPGRRQMPF